MLTSKLTGTAPDPRPQDRLLQLEGVSLAHRALPALRDIHWAPRPGEQWACLGRNGAGKTSLARVLAGEAQHFSGRYRRCAALTAGGIAYVCFEQARALCARDRKLDDSEFRADASDRGTTVGRLLSEATSDGAELDRWVDALGIRPILERGLRFISTGEMRKTLLARALLQNPCLAILDSPLDGLDRASQQSLWHILGQLLASPLRLLLLCRQPEDIPPGVTHVLLLDAGRVLAAGPREQILAGREVQALMYPPDPPLGPLPAAAPRSYSGDLQTPLLELRGVDVAYGDLEVLRAVNWTFRRGQHCRIAGPNGCGKSTLLSLITGDNHRAYGQDITLFGRRRGSGESVWEIKQRFGVLDNQMHLNFARSMRVVEVVVSGFFDTLGLFDAWGDRQRRTAEDWLVALGLGDLSRERFDELSFGQQRMVLLARAMVKSPLILLLDEPALGLDGPHRRSLLRAVDHIARHSDTQIIYVSHSAGEMPACINQQLEFVADGDGFALVCRED